MNKIWDDIKFTLGLIVITLCLATLIAGLYIVINLGYQSIPGITI